MNRPYLIKLVTLVFTTLILSACFYSGSGSNESSKDDQKFDAVGTLFITGMNPGFGIANTSVTLQVEGVQDNNITILLGAEEIIPTTINRDFSEIIFTVPADIVSGGIRVKHNDLESNTLWFSASENGVIAPTKDQIVVDSEGNRVSIGSIVVSLFEASDTRAEANRLAEIVSGEVVGRIPLLNAWQISVHATSIVDLEAIADTLELDVTVDFTFFDIEIEGEAIDWSNDPDRGEQRDRNRVEEGATLYENSVHPTNIGKVRPFFMAVGVSEGGVDFTHNDFSGYGVSGTSTSGNVSIYAPQSAGNHGSNVTGIVAAELGDRGNAGLVQALSSFHGGANISVGINSGSWSAGRISRTEQQLKYGATVINWSWGIHRSGTTNCTGNTLSANVVSSRNFTAYSKVITKFFAGLKKEYPLAVVVSSAGNGATDAGDAANRLPTSIVTDQLIVVGAHTSGGTVSISQTEDNEASASCFDNTIKVDVKRAPYSNYGSRVDISASGSIMGLINDIYAVGNRGTSYATPLVTATVALMQSINPNLTPTQIINLLRSSALPIENKVVEASSEDIFTRALTATESSSNAGKGARLNVEGAIQAALDSLASEAGRIVDPVDVSIGLGVTEITKTIELTIPGEGAVFDKVDIMFLVDVSGSYSDDLNTFRAKADALINAFDAAGSNVYIGLSSFSDFPISPYGESRDYAYQLDQALTADFDLVKNGLDNLTILSGNDFPESQLEGLFQTAQTETGWRSGALPVIFLATDASFHNSDVDTSYPGQGYTETLRYLTDNSVRVFGLQSGGTVSDVIDITNATGGKAFDLSRNSAEIVTAVQNALDSADNNITVELQPFGDFTGLVESITPQVSGAVSGEPITGVNAGDVVKFDVVFTKKKGGFTGSTTQIFSFRFKVIAEGVATILEVPVTVVLNN